MKSKKTMRSYRLEKSVLDHLKRLAIQQSRTQTNILEDAIHCYFQQHE